MLNHKTLGVAVLLGAFSLIACGDDTTGTGGNPGDGGSPPTSGGSPPTTGGNGTGGDNVGGDGTGGNNPAGYDFATEDYDAYTQIDRHGAVEAGTAGILAPAGLGLGGEDLSTRDDYNASNPVDDAAGMWIPEIAASVNFFHDNIDDDLIGLGLTPATFDQSVAQAGPVIVPDAIKYDPSMPTAYPNGRKLEDPVVDITLAAVLLDLGVHPLNLFASLPLNPPENDVEFKSTFPFLADPH